MIPSLLIISLLGIRDSSDVLGIISDNVEPLFETNIPSFVVFVVGASTGCVVDCDAFVCSPFVATLSRVFSSLISRIDVTANTIITSHFK